MTIVAVLDSCLVLLHITLVGLGVTLVHDLLCDEVPMLLETESALLTVATTESEGAVLLPDIDSEEA